MTDIERLDPDRLAPDAANPAVRSVMREEVVFCLPSTTIDAVAKLMADNDLTELPVLIDRRPVGYVEARDIVERLVEGRVVVAGSDVVRPFVTEVTASDILHTPPLLVDEKDRLLDVLASMRRQERQSALVMHEDERPVGMITAREVAAHLAAQLQGAPANA
ncbi:MAG TPA: CBS domain-containing protein [Candidatus Dormibacteraeota bacterium]|nr:CBS domain-containing protein [Candidatus Dormibacteraeota bacterium]